MFRFPPHACLSPANPDVTGIGVRISLYAQSLLTVIISSIAKYHGHKRALDDMGGLWRVQCYTLLAFAIAALNQRSKGQLSLFHETVIFHIMGLLLAGAVGVLVSIQVHSETSYLRTWCILFIPGLFFMIAFSMLDHCTPSQEELNNGFQHITWIFFFYMRLEYGSTDESFAALWLGAGGLIMLLWSFTLLLGLPIKPALVMGCPRPPGPYIPGIGLFILLASVTMLFWVEEVVAIELSLKSNSGFGTGLERNAWEFGQIIPLVLLIPYLEILKGQLAPGLVHQLSLVPSVLSTTARDSVNLLCVTARRTRDAVRDLFGRVWRRYLLRHILDRRPWATQPGDNLTEMREANQDQPGREMAPV
ncbi:hypothetical protein C8J56DRAFT_1027301 [Mycena floridula]|nr:hypothetical protein C8J56DRAFT_1027301 [Mycena floridula]